MILIYKWGKQAQSGQVPESPQSPFVPVILGSGPLIRVAELQSGVSLVCLAADTTGGVLVTT